MKRLLGLVVVLFGTAAVVAFAVLMGSLIFPGALKWTGGTVCPADKADTVVVRDTYQTEPGETSTNFTLYCIGDRGEIEDAGFGKPLAVLMAWAIGLAVALVLVLFVVGTVRRLARGRGGGDPGDGAEGPVGTVAPTEDYGGQPPLIT